MDPRVKRRARMMELAWIVLALFETVLSIITKGAESPAHLAAGIGALIYLEVRYS